MIDLTKYEGHTPGPWTWDADYHGLDGPERNAVLTHIDFEGMHLTYGDAQAPNARLIADAPLLLAEVKRQRAEIDQAALILGAIRQALVMGFAASEILDENSTIRDAMRDFFAKHGGA